MDAGGWSLIHMWLTDGIVAKNWALIQELLELLHLCPVKIERLKSNNCPKLIKGLSKEVTHQGVRVLAGRLVEQWLKIVKGEAAPNSVPAHIIGSAPQPMSNSIGHIEHQYTSPVAVKSDAVAEDANDEANSNNIDETKNHHTGKQSYVIVNSSTPAPFPVCKITIRDGNEVLVKVETDASNINSVLKGKPSHEMNGDVKDETHDENEDNVEKDEADNDCAVNENSSEVNQQTTVSSKDAGNAEVTAKTIKDDKTAKDTASSDSNKSSDKENRDSHKSDDKKSGSSGSGSLDKKSSSHHHSSKSGSSSKHGSSSHRTGSSSHRSSHRSSSSSGSRSSSSKDKSSRDKDRHHSSSSSKHSSSSGSSSKNKSERDKEREKEKEKLKKDQAEKDKATLEKVQAQAISSKLGKIPRKKPEDEKVAGESLLRKSSTESRDSSKENKEKTEAKRAGTTGSTVLEKKNISISIENRKNSQDAGRPKTVKTFNSKFRSTGLEEEVKPPPPRSTAKKIVPGTVDKKIIPAVSKPVIPSLKRSSPLRETSVPSDKRAKLSLDPPVTSPTEEKKGAIKLIPPKPKRKYLSTIRLHVGNKYYLYGFFHMFLIAYFQVRFHFGFFNYFFFMFQTCIDLSSNLALIFQDDLC